MDKTALVTGGSGFLGGHLVERLVAGGWAVRIVDVAEPLLDCDVEWLEADVRDAEAVRLAARGSTVVFHLAAVVGVERLLHDPVEAIDITVNGTLNALEAASAARSAVVYVSSSDVLGVNPKIPWDEGSDRRLGSPLVDRWSYASSKAASEHIVLAGAVSRGISATVVRPFNVYGPRQQPRFVVPLMVDAALAGRPIPVHNDGHQTRSFTHVSDAVAALVQVGEKPGVAPLLHVGNAEEISMMDLADLVGRTVGGEFSIATERPEDRLGVGYQDVPRRVPDASLARTLFGWTPEVPLVDGLAGTVEWTRRNRDRSTSVEQSPGLPPDSCAE